MSEEIINRVAKSGLITIDLADYAPNKEILEIDIKQFLFNQVILKEKEFRDQIKEFDFNLYQDAITTIICSANSIIPMWGFMLVASNLKKVNAKIYSGNKHAVFQKIFLENIDRINPSDFENKKIIVKGCSTIPISEELYIAITNKLQKNISSLMFGEACSAVPIYKKIK
jgi:hypothetical protein